MHSCLQHGKRQTQKKSQENRDPHIDDLAGNYAYRRDTTKAMDVKKIKQTETIQKLSAKHKFYLKERHGMIRTLMVSDYKVHQMFSVFGMLAWIALMGAFGGRGTEWWKMLCL